MATNDENWAPAVSGETWTSPAHAYTTLNPSLFDSVDHWSYRDLQKLAKRINVSARGKRHALVERLQAWHRQRRNGDQSGKFLTVEIRGLDALETALKSPSLPSVQGSPAPILSVNKSVSRLAQEERSPLRPHTGASVNFSPFNSVKVCRATPPAHAPHAPPHLQMPHAPQVPPHQHAPTQHTKEARFQRIEISSLA